jgi:hypothetical protein
LVSDLQQAAALPVFSLLSNVFLPAINAVTTQHTATVKVYCVFAMHTDAVAAVAAAAAAAAATHQVREVASKSQPPLGPPPLTRSSFATR